MATDETAIGKLKGPEQPADFTKPPTCCVCGLVAQALATDAPPGVDKKGTLGFVPNPGGPLDGWRYDHLSGGWYCPAETVPAAK